MALGIRTLGAGLKDIKLGQVVRSITMSMLLRPVAYNIIPHCNLFVIKYAF